MKFNKGIAITPKNFPSHTIKDVDDAFSIAKDICNQAVFVYQWHDFDINIVKLMLEKSKIHGIVPIVGISPTTLDKDRKELDIPEDLRKKLGKKITFKNEIIKEAFKKTAIELAKLKIPYLCLATEINFLTIGNLHEFLHFTRLYKDTYYEIKNISPETNIFVSFQWDLTRLIDEKEPNKIKEHTKVFDIFRPEIDIIGLTNYPANFYKDPSHLPDDYYFLIYRHIKDSDKVLFMELGWPTSGIGSEEAQVRFIQRLPDLVKKINLIGIDWALLHDVSIPQFDENLGSIGLITNDGRRKLGFDVFKGKMMVIN